MASAGRCCRTMRRAASASRATMPSTARTAPARVSDAARASWRGHARRRARRCARRSLPPPRIRRCCGASPQPRRRARRRSRTSWPRQWTSSCPATPRSAPSGSAQSPRRQLTQRLSLSLSWWSLRRRLRCVQQKRRAVQPSPRAMPCRRELRALTDRRKVPSCGGKSAIPMRSRGPEVRAVPAAL